MCRRTGKNAQADRKECAGGPERMGLDKPDDVGYYYLCGSKRPYKCRYGSMVEQLICNQQVGGSSPSIGLPLRRAAGQINNAG